MKLIHVHKKKTITSRIYLKYNSNDGITNIVFQVMLPFNSLSQLYKNAYITLLSTQDIYFCSFPLQYERLTLQNAQCFVYQFPPTLTISLNDSPFFFVRKFAFLENFLDSKNIVPRIRQSFPLLAPLWKLNKLIQKKKFFGPNFHCYNNQFLCYARNKIKTFRKIYPAQINATCANFGKEATIVTNEFHH
eukprot:TRINITY_DN12119_c0_g1_i1.p2 TRINITY_DN12119_c0_g1~~TRINITY_DN12119_c0_g1_i1.p2  ORF type:complete len:190 (+),score=-5.70 TRINITY_DN12119_c0_g1_i1:232-801(+)